MTGSRETTASAIIAVCIILICGFIVWRILLTFWFSGTSPLGVAISPDGSYVYVTNSGGIANDHGSVSVIDTVTNTVTTNIPAEDLADSGDGVAVSPDGRRVYATSNNGVFVIDTVTNTTTATIPTKTRPLDVAIRPDGRRLYVTSDARTVSVIDTAVNTIATTIPTTITRPGRMAVSLDGRHLYVTSSHGLEVNGSVSVIDTATNAITTTIVVGILPDGVAVSPDGHYVYVANGGPINQLPIPNQGSVSVIDTVTKTVTSTIPIRASPSHITVSPNGRHVYVAYSGGAVDDFIKFDGEVSMIDTVTGAVATTFDAGGMFPTGVVVSPDGHRIYVANGDSNTVRVIDTATPNIVANISSGHTGLIRLCKRWLGPYCAPRPPW